MTKVKCRRCAGKGTVPHRTAGHNATCYCCAGIGHYYRKPPRKPIDRIVEINAIIEREWANSKG